MIFGIAVKEGALISEIFQFVNLQGSEKFLMQFSTHAAAKDLDYDLI